MDRFMNLRERLSVALEWYRGCDAVPETLRNIQRDIDSIWRETRDSLPAKARKFRLRAKFDGSDIVVFEEPFDADTEPS